MTVADVSEYVTADNYMISRLIQEISRRTDDGRHKVGVTVVTPSVEPLYMAAASSVPMPRIATEFQQVPWFGANLAVKMVPVHRRSLLNDH